MNAVRLLTGVASVPVVAVRAALDAPRAAGAHPSSRELRRLLESGYTVTAYRLGRDPDGTQVTVQRGDDARTLASADLAFAAYVSHVVPRAVDRARRRERHRAQGLGLR